MDLSSLKALYFSPLIPLIERARAVHKQNFPPDQIQASRLLSVKTGGCSEDCAYCAQSARYQTGLKAERLLSLETVLEKARQAKKEGASRFCMGAAWREIPEGRPFERILEMVRAASALKMETCCSLGMLSLEQARRLKKAGLYAYNHNIDTSKTYYPKIISSRKREERFQTLQNVRKAGITVCTGGILGLGETHKDRMELIYDLISLNPQPESLTVNMLIPIKGTPLQNQKPVPASDVARLVAVLRIAAPKSFIRLSAGRKFLSEAEQLLCFLAGANSVFLGEKLLTAENPALSKDRKMLKSFGLFVQKKPVQKKPVQKKPVQKKPVQKTCPKTSLPQREARR